MKEFVALKAKTYIYLMDDDGEEKKAKGTNKCIIKQKLMLENYKDCLLNGEAIKNQNKDLKMIIIKCAEKMLIRSH